ncbi:hypothetical protein G6F23_013984 [Rhizopus arrhizus]|nr:hypothetical protein G6F23_013984 [Rhizopus arrhizus]
MRTPQEGLRARASIQRPGAALAGDGHAARLAVVHPLQMALVLVAQAPAVARVPGVGRPLAGGMQAGLSQALAHQHGGRGQRQRGGACGLRVRQPRGPLALDQARVQVCGGKGAVLHQARQEGHIGLHAHGLRLGQRLEHAGARLVAVGAVHDQLGDHGVVERGDRVARAHAAVHADVAVGKRGVRRQAQVGQRAD